MESSPSTAEKTLEMAKADRSGQMCCAVCPLVHWLRQGAPVACSCGSVAPARVALTVPLCANEVHIFRTDGQILTAGWPGSRAFLRPLSNGRSRTWSTTLAQPLVPRADRPGHPKRESFFKCQAWSRVEEENGSFVKPVRALVRAATSLTFESQTSTRHSSSAYQSQRWRDLAVSFSPPSPSSPT